MTLIIIIPIRTLQEHVEVIKETYLDPLVTTSEKNLVMACTFSGKRKVESFTKLDEDYAFYKFCQYSLEKRLSTKKPATTAFLPTLYYN